jgi:2-polyprenyl-3-methyl-5-hydroxy-6-metoxy-1,4-benzoquinol methylase
MRKQPVKTWSTPVSAESSALVPCALCGGGGFRPALSCEGFLYVRCKRCGLVQMNPQPAAGEVMRRYRETFGGDYLAYELANEAAFLELQRLALKDAGFAALERELFDREKAPHVLDAGCATGALLLWLRERGWETVGLEISPSAEYARTKRGLDVRSLSLEESRFPDGYFDLFLASHLIEHLNDPRSFVHEAWRVTQPGGRIFITTPNIAGFQARLFGSRWRSAIFDHLYLFSVRTLKALLAHAGFTVEGVFTWGGLAAGTAPRRLKKFIDRAVKPLSAGDVMLVRAVKPL